MVPDPVCFQTWARIVLNQQTTWAVCTAPKTLVKGGLLSVLIYLSAGSEKVVYGGIEMKIRVDFVFRKTKGLGCQAAQRSRQGKACHDLVPPGGYEFDF